MATFNAPETTTAVPASPASYNGQSFRTEPLSACVKTIMSDDRDHIITALVMAFSADPMSRWMYPNPHQYLTYFPRFVEIFGGKAFEFNTVYSNRAHSGAALWFPPGVEPDNEPVADLLRQSIFETDQAQVFAVFEEMERYHPTFPHWYLPILGVDPTQQGKGYGSALLQPILNQCDRDRMPAYLESSNPANIPFYERHGFEVLGTIQLGNSPQVSPMIRYSS